MLYTQTVTGATLGLLKELMALPELNQFGLVGGTNLSLRFRHRISIDFSRDIFHLLRSLVYFNDAEPQKDPDPLKKVTWNQVKSKVQKAVKKYLDANT